MGIGVYGLDSGRVLLRGCGLWVQFCFCYFIRSSQYSACF